MDAKASKKKMSDRQLITKIAKMGAQSLTYQSGVIIEMCRDHIGRTN